MNLKSFKVTQIQLVVLSVVFMVVFDNYTFFKSVYKAYPTDLSHIGFFISLFFLLIAVNAFLFTLVSSKYTTKFILIVVLLISSLTNYFMNTYNIVIDDDMIRNIVQTNFNESADLLTPKQILYFIFLGILPSYFVYRLKISYGSFKEEFIQKLKYTIAFLLIITILIFIFSKHYTFFF